MLRSPFFCDPFKFCILSVKKRQWNYQRLVQKPSQMRRWSNDKDDLDFPSQALVCVQRIWCPQEPQISPVKTSAKHTTRRNNENGLQNDRLRVQDPYQDERTTGIHGKRLRWLRKGTKSVFYYWMCNEDRWVRWNQRDSFVKLVSEACTRWSFSLKHYDDNSIRRASLETRKGDAKRKNGKRGIGYLWNDEPVKCRTVKMENPLKWESVKKIACQKDYKGFPPLK